MCRHVAYVGPAVPLAGPLLDAPHALVHQARAPHHQGADARNVDGWGVAWWPGPRQRRTVAAMPDDGAGHPLLRATSAGAFMAAVRRASPGATLAATGNAPFVDGGLAFSLNGFVGGWFDGGAGESVRSMLSPRRRAALAGDADSEVLFAFVLDRLDEGAGHVDALAMTIAAARRAAGERRSRLNLLLGDGERVWATRAGNSLFAFTTVDAAVVASEPWDDDDRWEEIPDGSVLEARPARVVFRALD